MFTLLVLFACGSSAPESPQVHPDHAPHAEHPKAEPAHDTPAAEGLVLTLDGADKWPMDAHTRKVMSTTRTTLAQAELKTVDDAKALGKTLQGQGDQLIEGCTMEGPAHDELHVFLMAWFPEVTHMQSTTELADGRARLQKMRTLVAEYDKFFE